MPPLQAVRRSDRTDVGCTHAEGCPLFPLLRASLRSWRDHYCDSEDRWRSCARYQQAVAGRLVPISLLPNGKEVEHLRRAADQSSAAEAPPTSRPAPPPQPDRGSAEATAWFESAPGSRPAPPTRVDRGSPDFRASSEPAGVSPRTSAWSRPSQVPPSQPDAPSRRQHVPQRRAPKSHWWTRLIDWMRGSA
jgi:hypothetical protein